MFPIQNNNMLGAVNATSTSASKAVPKGPAPFADISAGAGTGDSTSFSTQSLFGNNAPNGIPQSSLDFIKALNAETDVQGFVEDGSFSQSTLNVLKQLAK